MSTLVVGGTGFLGSYLLRLLVEEGSEEVVVLDRSLDLSRIEDISDEVRLVEGDILDLDQLSEVIGEHGVTRIAHLASIPGPAAPERIVPYVQTQCIGTANVFEAARLHGIKRVVNASSSAAFGRNTGRSVDEDAPARPANSYGACKLWTEHVAETYNTLHGMEILSFRVCASMGYGRLTRAWLGERLMPQAHERHFIAYPELAAAGEAVVMPPDDLVIDVLHASDTALAWSLALSAKAPRHRVFNLRAEQRPVGDMTRELRRLLPDADITVGDEVPPVPQLMDTTRLVEELGFEPRHTLESALAAYVSEVQTRHRTAV
jgi:nucleoside-diphosphate-sugar epimerase